MYNPNPAPTTFHCCVYMAAGIAVGADATSFGDVLLDFHFRLDVQSLANASAAPSLIKVYVLNAALLTTRINSIYSTPKLL